jgi:hypothetical protein
MTVAEFFQLNPEEARSTQLSGLLERLKAMAGDAWQPASTTAEQHAEMCADAQEAAAGGPTTSQGPATTAPPTRTTRRTVSRTAAATSDAPASSLTAVRARRTRAATVQVQEEQQPQTDHQQPVNTSMHDDQAGAALGVSQPAAGLGAALRRQPLASREPSRQQAAQVHSMQQEQQQIPLQQHHPSHGPPRKPVAGEVAFSANGEGQRWGARATHCQDADSDLNSVVTLCVCSPCFIKHLQGACAVCVHESLMIAAHHLAPPVHACRFSTGCRASLCPFLCGWHTCWQWRRLALVYSWVGTAGNTRTSSRGTLSCSTAHDRRCGADSSEGRSVARECRCQRRGSSNAGGRWYSLGWLHTGEDKCSQGADQGCTHACWE